MMIFSRGHFLNRKATATVRFTWRGILDSYIRLESAWGKGEESVLTFVLLNVLVSSLSELGGCVQERRVNFLAYVVVLACQGFASHRRILPIMGGDPVDINEVLVALENLLGLKAGLECGFCTFRSALH